MDNTTVDSMCRCCAAEGIFKDIKTSYLWMGEEEVYGDMLRECFDVKLATIEEGGICEVCITQLRNAVNFKKQVVHTEKKFKRHLESRRFKPTEVKEEVSGDNGNSSDDNDNGGADSEDDEDYVPDFEIPIKTESPEEAKSRKRSAKATTSRAKKSRSSDVAEKSLASKTRGAKTTVSTRSKKSTNKADEAKKNRDISKSGKKTSGLDDIIEIHDDDVKSGKNKRSRKEDYVIEIHDDVSKSSKNKKIESKKRTRKEDDTIEINDQPKGDKRRRSESKKKDVTFDIRDDSKERRSKSTKRSKRDADTSEVSDHSKKRLSKSEKRSGKEEVSIISHDDSNKKRCESKKRSKEDDTIEIRDDSKKKRSESKKISMKDVIENRGVSKSDKNKKAKSKKKSEKDKDFQIETFLSKKRSGSKTSSRKKDDVTDINDDVLNGDKKKRSESNKRSKKINQAISKSKETESNSKSRNDGEVIKLREISKSEYKKMMENKNISEQDEGFEINTRTRKDDSFLEIEVTELDKHLHNIRTILYHSNATPIQNHNETGFSCGFCIEQYLLAAELKMHTLENHGEEDIHRFMGGQNIFAYVVKLDITSLRCVLCARKIFTLELLMEHLETKHDKMFYKDIKNHILPFKFQSDVFSCIICDRRFDRFKQMQWHMSVHYRNYECDDCNKAFINKATLRTHINRHRTGIFKCSFCNKSFDTKEKWTVHEKYVHMTDHKRNKCTYCNELFTRYAKKMEHMVVVHGHKQRVVKCLACSRTFKTKEKLTKHNKRDHLLMRNYKCDKCDSCFFDNYDLRRHKRTHMDAKPFSCEICQRGFNRRDNMLEHTRIHTGENKRFSCDRCGVNFPHMTRLKKHMEVQHKELEKLI